MWIPREAGRSKSHADVFPPQTITPIPVGVAGSFLHVALEGDARALQPIFETIPRSAPPGPSAHLHVRVDDAIVNGVAPRNDEPRHHRSGDLHSWTTAEPATLQRFDPADGVRLELVLSSHALEDGVVRARPAMQALSAWLTYIGTTPLHASVISRDGHALLLLGPGGTGKTTTALALAARGWGLLAEDRCFLEATPTGSIVHGLYPSAMLTTTTYERLYAFDWPQYGRSHERKWAVGFPSHIAYVPRARVAAIVTLQPSTNRPSALRPLTPRERLHAWWSALSNTLHAHAPRDAWLPTLGRFAPSTPAHALGIDWDFARIDDILTHHLTSLTEPRASA